MTSEREATLIEHALTALGSDRSSPELVGAVEITGPSGHLTSRLPVEEVALACVATALTSALALQEQRQGTPLHASLERGHVAAAVRSERYFRRGGSSAGVGFAALSRFWRTADGWVRTHANYPWHREALLSTLGVSDDADAVAAALAEMRAEAVEEQVFAAGGIAAAIRTQDRWQTHPQGRVLASEPLISHTVTGDAAARTRPAAALPAAGIRVLDLTRVIAGPICTRYLGALGADVLRVDPPGHLDLKPGEVADTLLGKRTTMLDLGVREHAETLHELLHDADLVVCGYRPGALDRFGLDEQTLAERHPGIVTVYLSAWGHTGPWAGRRGFDSVVQGPTGIAMRESDNGSDPGALPCQLLDHGTGYLAAAAALDGLRRQADTGGTHVRRLSLARTARWLTSAPQSPSRAPDENDDNDESEQWLTELETGSGVLTAVLPPGQLDGQPIEWPRPPSRYGNDPPEWRRSPLDADR